MTRIEDLGIWIPDSTLKIAYNACQRAYGRGTNIGRIPSLCEEIRRLGGFAWWQPVDAASPTKTLYRVFASLPPTSQFFGRYVPPGIVVDGTYMRNGTNMSLLTAIMRTGENHIIPLAIALVPNETASNWEFFFRCLLHTLREANFADWRQMVITSDGCKGIASAFARVFAELGVKHTICVRHLASAAANAQRKNDPEMKESGEISNDCCMAFRNSCYAITPEIREIVARRCPPHIQRRLIQMIRYAEEKYQNTQMWRRSDMDFCNFENMTNNNAESFNASARDKERKCPLFDCIYTIWKERVYDLIGTWAAELDRSESVNSVLTPYMTRLIRHVSGKFRCTVGRPMANEIFPVSHNDARFNVNIEERTCTCGWTRTKCLRPCIHVCSLVQFLMARRDQRALHLIHECYWMDTYRTMLETPRPPPPQLLVLRNDNILPPPYCEKTGRKRKERRRIPELETCITGTHNIPYHPRYGRPQAEEQEQRQAVLDAEYVLHYGAALNIAPENDPIVFDLSSEEEEEEEDDVHPVGQLMEMFHRNDEEEEHNIVEEDMGVNLDLEDDLLDDIFGAELENGGNENPRKRPRQQ